MCCQLLSGSASLVDDTSTLWILLQSITLRNFREGLHSTASLPPSAFVNFTTIHPSYQEDYSYSTTSAVKVSASSGSSQLHKYVFLPISQLPLIAAPALQSLQQRKLSKGRRQEIEDPHVNRQFNPACDFRPLAVPSTYLGPFGTTVLHQENVHRMMHYFSATDRESR